jgi:PQQ-like domain
MHLYIPRMVASSGTPAQSPTSAGDTEPPTRPKVRGRTRLVILGGVVIVTAGLVAAGIAVWRAEPQDPGEKVAQPHRAATAFPQPAAGQPRWAVPDHHWTALTKAWTAVGPGPNGGGWDARRTRLVSDGKRAIAYEAGLLTAYDGATGKQIWRRPLAWDGLYEPVAGDGVVIVPLHGSDGRFRDCVALDSATGAQRWREPLCPGSTPVDGPVGTLSHGVFYSTSDRTITGVDAATGKRRYQRKFAYDIYLSAPAVANDRIVLSGNWWSPASRSRRE